MCRLCRAKGLLKGGEDLPFAYVAAGSMMAGPCEVDDVGPCEVAVEAGLGGGGGGALNAAGFISDSVDADAAEGTRGGIHRVVVGAGVAGTCCAEELCRLRPNDRVTMLTAADVVKSVHNVERITRNIEVFDVIERPATALKYPNLTVQTARVVGLNAEKKVVYLSPPSSSNYYSSISPAESCDVEREGGGNVNDDEVKGEVVFDGAEALKYDQLCVCSGAAPRTALLPSSPSSFPSSSSWASQSQSMSAAAAAAAEKVMVTVRDTDSVDELRRRLASARRVLLVGNGGIAMELAGALCGGGGSAKAKASDGQSRRGQQSATSASTVGGDGDGDGDEKSQTGYGGGSHQPSSSSAASGSAPELVWTVRHSTIGDAFFDRDAAAFLLGLLKRGASTSSSSISPFHKAATAAAAVEEVVAGAETRKKSRMQAVGNVAYTRGDEMPPRGDEPHVGRKRRRRVVDEVEEGDGGSSDNIKGSAAGPDWLKRLVDGLGSGTARCGGGAGAGAGEAGGIYYTSNSGPRISSVPHPPPSVASEEETATASSFDPFRLRLFTDCELVAIEPPGASPNSNVDEGKLHDDDDDTFKSKSESWPAFAVLTDGTRLGVDLVVSATGVDPAPCVDWLPSKTFPRGDDGGIAVDECQRALGGDGSVFAAGDAASSRRSNDPSHHWFQMRLWGQARASGTYSARVMVGEADELALGFNFELFTHTTTFFGQKVILLGLYNGQKMEHEPEGDVVMYTRSEYDPEPVFIRVLLLRGKMMGAVLIGDTGLEETFENLILDGIDLSRYGPEILDPDVDIEDFFD